MDKDYRKPNESFEDDRYDPERKYVKLLKKDKRSPSSSQEHYDGSKLRRQ